MRCGRQAWRSGTRRRERPWRSSWRRRARRHGHGLKHEKGRREAVFLCVFCLRAGGWVLRCPGGEQVLRLRARDGAFRAPARVTFFFCKKKVTKENHSNLRFKDPLARGGFRRCGGEQVLRLRARAGEFRAPARVPFFFCKKKGTKENHLDLRSKDPLARCGSCRFGGMHSRMKCSG